MHNLSDGVIHIILILGEYCLAPILLVFLKLYTDKILNEEVKDRSPHPIMRSGLEFMLLGSVGLGLLSGRSISENVTMYFSFSLILFSICGGVLVLKYLAYYTSFWVEENEIKRYTIPIKAAALIQVILIQCIFIFLYLEHKIDFVVLSYFYLPISLLCLVGYLQLNKSCNKNPYLSGLHLSNAIESIKHLNYKEAMNYFFMSVKSAKNSDEVLSILITLDDLCCSRDSMELINTKLYLSILSHDGSPGEKSAIRLKLFSLCLKNKIDCWNLDSLIRLTLLYIPNGNEKANQRELFKKRSSSFNLWLPICFSYYFLRMQFYRVII